MHPGDYERDGTQSINCKGQEDTVLFTCSRFSMSPGAIIAGIHPRLKQ